MSLLHISHILRAQRVFEYIKTSPIHLNVIKPIYQKWWYVFEPDNIYGFNTGYT